jgi:hypothetical protein
MRLGPRLAIAGRMSSRAIVGVVWCVMLLAPGCAHHRVVGRPPTTAEIQGINQAGEGSPMMLQYADPQGGCQTTVCTIEGVRSISDTPPLQIERILDADARQVRVVDQGGKTWGLDLSNVGGVSTQSSGGADGAIAGSVFGLIVGGGFVFLSYFFSGPPADASVNQPPSQPLSAPAAIATCVVSTVIGAAIGALIGHQMTSSRSFDFGGGHLFVPSSFSR